MDTIPIRLHREIFPLEGMLIDFGQNTEPPDRKLLILATIAALAVVALAVWTSHARAKAADAVRESALLGLSDRDAVTLQPIYEGTPICGSSGGGKTTEPGKKVPRVLIPARTGFCVLSVKSDAPPRKEMGSEAGRGSDVQVRLLSAGPRVAALAGAVAR